MRERPPIVIGDKIWHANPDVDRYQIPIGELHDLRMREIPPNSHLEVVGYAEDLESVGSEVYGLNDGDSLRTYGGATYRTTKDGQDLALRRMRLAFPDHYPNGDSIIPTISLEEDEHGNVLIHSYLGRDYSDTPDLPVREAMIPYSRAFAVLARPLAQLFICHASEDKPAARSLAQEVQALGTEVWFDEWEIRVGDSIVQKINDALGRITHLIVLLSCHSVPKPWVQREISSALMQQLDDSSITILPVRLDDCEIPPILRDIKYADFRTGIDNVISEITRSLTSASHETTKA